MAFQRSLLALRGGDIAVEDDALLGGAEAVGLSVFVGHSEEAIPLFLEDGRVFFEEVFEVGDGVDEIEFARLTGERTGEILKAAFEDGGEEGIVEVDDEGAGRVVEGGGVSVKHFDGVALLPVGGEALNVGSGNCAELRGEFDADDAAERETRGEHDGTAFSASEVDEGEALPVEIESGEDLGKERGRDAVVGGAPEIVGVAGGKVFAPDDAAGFGAVRDVEGVNEIGSVVEGVAGIGKRRSFNDVKASPDLLGDDDDDSLWSEFDERLKKSSHDGTSHRRR